MTPQQLRDLLADLGLTQAEAALRLKIADRTVRRWVAGKARIPAYLDERALRSLLTQP